MAVPNKNLVSGKYSRNVHKFHFSFSGHFNFTITSRKKWKNYFFHFSLLEKGESCACSPHTSYLSREPREYPCIFFLAGVNFYRFYAKNWHFRQILREKVTFFTDLTRKIGVFRCKFYSPKILPV